jgi:hypothetical protein
MVRLPSQLLRAVLAAFAATALVGAAAPAGEPENARRTAEDAIVRAVARSKAKELATKVPRPPTDEGKYSVALAHLLAAPAAEVFGFAAWNGRLPEEALGGSLQLGRASVRVASLVVDQPPASVLESYRDQLSKRFDVRVGSLASQGGSFLSLRDPADGFMRSLTFVPAAQGTVVLAAAGDPARIAPPSDASVPSAFPQDLPMPPLVSDPTDLTSKDGPFLQHARSAVTEERRPDALAMLLLARMREQAWTAEPDSLRSVSPQRTLVFTKPGRRCTVTIAPPTPTAAGCSVGWLCVERSP